jgi:hypothetical protein
MSASGIRRGGKPAGPEEYLTAISDSSRKFLKIVFDKKSRLV